MTVVGHVGWLAYWRGRWRLRWGWCPLCYSSPPRDDCPVCHGSYDYGPRLTTLERDRWRRRLDRLRRG